ncbi:MAG: hypothetical protein ACYSSL_09010, partial [Planctomycetota bacterium]
LRRSVLSKAPLRSAFLKTRRICVIYSHNNWYIKRGQAICFTIAYGRWLFRVIQIIYTIARLMWS